MTSGTPAGDAWRTHVVNPDSAHVAYSIWILVDGICSCGTQDLGLVLVLASVLHFPSVPHGLGFGVVLWVLVRIVTCPRLRHFCDLSLVVPARYHLSQLVADFTCKI